MSTRLFVDNLALATTESELVALFPDYGNVVDVNIAVDHTSHKPRGFGFVTMVTPEGARAAIQSLNGKARGPDTLTVSEASPREEIAKSSKSGRNPRRDPGSPY